MQAVAIVYHCKPEMSTIQGIFIGKHKEKGTLSQIIFLNCYISNTVLQYFEIPSIFSYIEAILLLRAVTDTEIIIQSE